MSATSVLITPSGGLGTVLMFLQPGASAIVFNFYQDYAKHTEQQENIYYWCVTHPAALVQLRRALRQRMHASAVTKSAVALHLGLHAIARRMVWPSYGGVTCKPKTR